MTTNESCCEPPPEWRERIARAINEGLGPNWACCNYGGDEWNSCRYMLDDAADKVLAIVTPPATVAALVEALEAADQFIRNGIELGFIRMPSPSTPDPAHGTPDKVAAALALYRGEAGQ